MHFLHFTCQWCIVDYQTIFAMSEQSFIIYEHWVIADIDDCSFELSSNYQFRISHSWSFGEGTSGFPPSALCQMLHGLIICSKNCCYRASFVGGIWSLGGALEANMWYRSLFTSIMADDRYKQTNRSRNSKRAWGTSKFWPNNWRPWQSPGFDAGQDQ